MAWTKGNSVLIIAWDYAGFGPLFRAVFRSVAAAAFSPRLQPGVGSKTRSNSRETATAMVSIQ